MTPCLRDLTPRHTVNLTPNYTLKHPSHHTLNHTPNHTPNHPLNHPLNHPPHHTTPHHTSLQFATILAFDVPIDNDAVALAEELNVKVSRHAIASQIK